MAMIMVTPEELRTQAATLREYNAQFKTQVSNLEASEQTLGQSWKGEANDAFRNAFNNDKQCMNNFAASIEQFCGALESIAATYSAAEAVNTETATIRG